MNGMKSLLVCLLLGSVVLPVDAQAQEAAVAPKQATAPTERAPAEKSVLTESSTQAAKPEAAAAEFCRCVGEGDNSVSRRIEKALATPLHRTGLDYVDQPLEDIVAQLMEEYGIPIQINKAALEEAGISPDTKISATIHNVSFRSGLRLMLKTSQLTYLIENEVLLITTKEDAEKDVKVCVYDVRRLASDNGDLTQLIEIICSCVVTDTWARNGKGVAEIRPFKPGLLVIAQTHLAHEEIRNLLTTLDEMRHDRQGNLGGAPPKAAANGATERRYPATPAAPVVSRKAATFADPAPSEATPDNPFSG